MGDFYISINVIHIPWQQHIHFIYELLRIGLNINSHTLSYLKSMKHLSIILHLLYIMNELIRVRTIIATIYLNNFYENTWDVVLYALKHHK